MLKEGTLEHHRRRKTKERAKRGKIQWTFLNFSKTSLKVEEKIITQSTVVLKV